jgi:hypothetical protein
MKGLINKQPNNQGNEKKNRGWKGVDKYQKNEGEKRMQERDIFAYRGFCLNS